MIPTPEDQNNVNPQSIFEDASQDFVLGAEMGMLYVALQLDERDEMVFPIRQANIDFAQNMAQLFGFASIIYAPLDGLRQGMVSIALRRLNIHFVQ